ncbi:hypothetical protein GCM10023156_71520 [Novipirellula rosea]|uniref:Uncharacterized protein n=2 Tax=Novipirellula rosea TaxID=1031540 RepID=A0ABP8NX08_9BACT
MIQRLVLAAGLVATLCGVMQSNATAGDPYAVTHIWNQNFAMDRPWHGPYYHQNYGQPLALVVPPTAHMRQTLSWGVSQNLMYPVHHQYGRNANYPGAAAPGSFYATPGWPSHTDQFGVYYVRGPW